MSEDFAQLSAEVWKMHCRLFELVAVSPLLPECDAMGFEQRMLVLGEPQLDEQEGTIQLGLRSRDGQSVLALQFENAHGPHVNLSAITPGSTSVVCFALGSPEDQGALEDCVRGWVDRVPGLPRPA